MLVIFFNGKIIPWGGAIGIKDAILAVGERVLDFFSVKVGLCYFLILTFFFE